MVDKRVAEVCHWRGGTLTSCVDMSHCSDLSDGMAALGLTDSASGINDTSGFRWRIAGVVSFLRIKPTV